MQIAQEKALDGYGKHAFKIGTHRATEYEAVGQITRALKIAIERQSNDKSKLATAIHRNRELWSLLATQVADDTNELPVDLRARIFSLAEFVRKHSSQVLLHGADGQVLVDINTAIMQGLNSRRLQ